VIGIGTLCILGLVIWATLLGRRFRQVSTGPVGLGWLEAGAGGVVAAMIWWAFVRWTGPGITDLSTLMQSPINAGGGTVPTIEYCRLLGLAFSIGALFACMGHFICRKSGAFTVTSFALRDIGLFFFIGMAAFLTLFASAAMASGHAFASYVIVMTLFVAVTLYTIQSQRVGQRALLWIRTHGTTVLAISPILITVLCLLQFVVTKRGGPLYDVFAQFIVANNRIPMINRHFGQSLLASGVMFLVGAGKDLITYPRATVNNWLYVSQIAFLFLVYRFLREMGTSRPGAVFGLIYMMLGNAALSLVPHILYDHDYPVIMNIYADSIFGLAGFVIFVWYLLSRGRYGDTSAGPRTSWWPTLVVPALIVMAFTYTAELNMALALAVVALLVVLTPFERLTRFRIPLKELIAILLVSVCVIGAGAFQGGVLANQVATAEQKKSPFFEVDASAATMSAVHARWWYLPVVIPGIPTGYGNLTLPSLYLADPHLSPDARAAWAMGTSMNEPLMEKFFADKSGRKFRYIYAIYLAEMRLFQALRLVWFPFVGLAMLGVLVIATGSGLRLGGSDTETARLRLFWVLSAAAFTAGFLVVFFTNAVRGDALFWKWALTRFFEPGLCLGTLAFAIALDRFLKLVRSAARRYVIWTGLALVSSFATLFRIFAYQYFDG
jgi:hypothetical protein